MNRILRKCTQIITVWFKSKGLPTRCKISCTVAMDTTPNDFWNILQHLACKILRARLCLHVARRQSNKMPSHIVENIFHYRHSQ